jgi:hypothetical protein
MVEKEPIKKIVGSQGNLEKQKYQVSSFVQACNESSQHWLEYDNEINYALPFTDLIQRDGTL